MFLNFMFENCIYTFFIVSKQNNANTQAVIVIQNVF